MWLLNAKTLQLEHFFEADTPSYAILSHRWGKEEVTFQEMQLKQAVHKSGYQKIKGCCSQAAADQLDYVWVDTCCIDKTSSAELSEAINSMFQWYRNAYICYVYLDDVPSVLSVRDPSWDDVFDVKGAFKDSKWFTRGWTLQELIAPDEVEFYAQDWTAIGTKREFCEELTGITGIDIGILQGKPLSSCNIAEKFSWAAFRETTRLEDKAYSLLGIFEVSLPLLYGEGSKAFIRLQEEILKTTEDYTVFAWSAIPDILDTLKRKENDVLKDILSPLADDPSKFMIGDKSHLNYSDLIPISRGKFKIKDNDSHPSLIGLGMDDSPPTLTGRGLRVCLPILWSPRFGKFLACIYLEVKERDQLVCFALQKVEPNSDLFRRELSESNRFHLVDVGQLPYFRRLTIYIEQQTAPRETKNERDYDGLVSKADILHDNGQRLLRTSGPRAEDQFSKAVALRKRMLGPSHRSTLESMNGVSAAIKRQKRWSEAEELDREIVQRRFSGKGDARSITNLAWSIFNQDRWTEAEEMLLGTVKDSNTRHGKSSPITLDIMAKLIAISLKQNRPTKAKKEFEAFTKQFDTFLGVKRPQSYNTIRNILWAKENCAKWSGNEELLEQVVEIGKEIRGKDDPWTLQITCVLAAIYVEAGRQKEAEGLQEYVYNARANPRE